jgi:primosomal protein N'
MLTAGRMDWRSAEPSCQSLMLRAVPVGFERVMTLMSANFPTGTV